MSGRSLEIVQVDLATRSGKRTFQMLRHAGRDQIAAVVAAGGWESWERPLPECFFACAAANDGLVIDAGANTGFYALLAAAANDRNHIVAFEPSPSIRSHLNENLAINTFGQQISVHPLALSNRSGSACLYIPDPSHGLIETSSSLEPEFQQSCSVVIEVAAMSLDAFFASGPFSNTPVAMIKIDVEGHELSVLEGASETIARWRPIIFVEVLAAADFTGLTRFIVDRCYTNIPLSTDGTLEERGEIAFVPQAWNHALVPQDQCARIKTLWRKNMT
jgi:FkbM family methyltransferase